MAYEIDCLHLVTIFFPLIDNLKVYKCQRFLAVRHIHIVTPNPSNAEATFFNSTRTQRFLKTLSCWYTLGNSRRVLSDEYPYTRVSVIFQDFCITLYWPN